MSRFQVPELQRFTKNMHRCSFNPHSTLAKNSMRPHSTLTKNITPMLFIQPSFNPHEEHHSDVHATLNSTLTKNITPMLFKQTVHGNLIFGDRLCMAAQARRLARCL